MFEYKLLGIQVSIEGPETVYLHVVYESDEKWALYSTVATSKTEAEVGIHRVVGGQVMLTVDLKEALDATRYRPIDQARYLM